jgi:hypothetical protein
LYPSAKAFSGRRFLFSFRTVSFCRLYGFLFSPNVVCVQLTDDVSSEARKKRLRVHLGAR